jgi:hypothetical protein
MSSYFCYEVHISTPSFSLSLRSASYRSKIGVYLPELIVDVMVILSRMHRVNKTLRLKQKAHFVAYLNKMHNNDINTAQSHNNENSEELLR